MLGKPAGGEGLLHAGGDKDTAFTVLRLRAAVETYAGTSGDLGEDGQEAFETRGLRDLHFVDECGDEIVCVFEGVAEIYRSLHEFAGALVEIVRDAVELAGNGLRAFTRSRRRTILADEFVVHRKKTHAKKDTG